jgi:ABC-type phosphate/phosphonate transport system permease subunit
MVGTGKLQFNQETININKDQTSINTVSFEQLMAAFINIKTKQGMNEHQQSLWEFMQQQAGKLAVQTMQHIGLTFISLFIAVIIGLPFGFSLPVK